MKLLLAVEACVVAGLVVALLHAGKLDRVLGRDHALRGSRPPAGQQRPRLDAIHGIEPALPTRGQLHGQPQLLLATCASCRTGDVFGSLVDSIAARGLPRGTRIDVVVWKLPAALATDGRSIDDWQRAHLRNGAHLHVARTAAAARALQRALYLPPDGGFGYVYDGRGRWRSTYPIGLARVDDVLHDLAALRT